MEPGLRFDWDEIVRRPLVSPRLAAVYSPPGDKDKTKISAGIGLYYEHTQLEYLAQTYRRRSLRHVLRRECTDGVTPTGPAQETEFTANDGSLHEPRALNWSVGVERKLPWSIFAGANFLEKRTSNVFTFANQSGRSGAGRRLSADQWARRITTDSEEFDARRLFANGYTLYVSYTHSSARTNAALDYLPTPSPLGPQQSGPLAWDTPNRVISWGWLPVPIAKLKKALGFCLPARPAHRLSVHGGERGAAGGGRGGGTAISGFVNFSPGLEWKFHFRGQYWGLRGVMENATDSGNPAVVNNVVDSPEFGTFSEFQGRAFTARIRLIGAK